MVHMLANPLAVLMFCLTAGFLLGRIRLRILNSTLATLLIAIAVNLLMRQFDAGINIPSALSSLGFAFFSFAVGFSAGPGFVDAIHGDGIRSTIKQVLLSVVYCGLVVIAVMSIGYVWPWSSAGSIRGLLAGALTQSTILDQVPNGDAMASVAYGISYPLGMVAIIVFVQSIVPFALGVTPIEAVRRHLNNLGRNASTVGFHLPSRLIQMRAYRVNERSPLIGSTIEKVEAMASRHFEIVSVYSGGDVLLPDITQTSLLGAGDVIVAIGDLRIVRGSPFEGFEETADERYLSLEFVLADIVLADRVDGALEELTGKGILLRSIVRNGRVLPERQFQTLRSGDIVRVAGLSRSVSAFAKNRGYLRDDGAPTDLLSLTFAIAVAVVIGAISICGVSLGTGCCSLMFGLVLGWFHHRRPNVAHIPSSALLLMRTLGLNVFICAMALNASLTVDVVCNIESLHTMVNALLLALIPLLGTFVVGRYILRLQPISLLGGLCGCGTCTPALNALEEEAGSSVFTAAYTIPYVASNILLTLVGSFVGRSI